MGSVEDVALIGELDNDSDYDYDQRIKEPYIHNSGLTQNRASNRSFLPISLYHSIDISLYTI